MSNYLVSIIKQFEYYKQLGEKSINQMEEESLFIQYNEECNSVANLVNHLSGNMISRWTDFLDSDGEKEWRNRDSEFENTITNKTEMLLIWEKGWNVLFDTLKSLTESDLGKTVYIRNQGHSVIDAINRQLAHYPYHIGQIVFISKMYSKNWKALTIPKGQSADFNKSKFSEPKTDQNFADEFLKETKEEILKKLLDTHQNYIQFLSDLNENEMMNAPANKWNALQHAKHVTMIIQSFSKYANRDKQLIKEKFGPSTHLSKTYSELESVYLNKAKDLTPEKGFVQPFEPGDILTSEREQLIKNMSEATQSIIDGMMKWNEEELDSLQCPHPAFGFLNAREMLYFHIFHGNHHFKISVKQLS